MASRIAQLLDRQRAAKMALLDRLVRAIFRTWERAPRTPEGRQSFGQDAAALVRAAQRQTANRVIAVNAKIIEDAGEKPPPPIDLPINEQAKPDQWEQLAAELDQLEAGWQEAIQSTAESDLDSAEESVRTEYLGQTHGGIIGYRRVVHPDQVRGGSCGLCLAASTRIYRTPKLRPIHDGCHCTVLPITRTADPGGFLNMEDLGDVYAAAGGTTDGWILKRLRYDSDGKLLSKPARTTKRQVSFWDDLTLLRHQAEVIAKLPDSEYKRTYAAKLANRIAELDKAA